ncbi:MAG: GNAT family N-acetyltransferase [Myxococcota bacterium]
MVIHQATIVDLDAIVPLFDADRRFYGRESDPAGARSFLRDRFEHRQSVLFLARADAGAAVGFTQLYPSFSSTALARIFVLNDLFVAPGARRRRVGTLLLDAADGYAAAVGAVRLTLSTAVDNRDAQALDRANGWQRDEQFLVFQKIL